MRTFKIKLAVLCLILVVSGCGLNNARENTVMERQRYELIFETDSGIDIAADSACATTDGIIFYVKESGGEFLLEGYDTGDGSSMEFGGIEKTGGKWIYSGDGYIVFRGGDGTLSSIAYPGGTVSAVDEKEKADNILIEDNRAFYIGGTGLVCSVDLTSGGLRMIDQSVNGSGDRHTLFRDVNEHDSVYYWKSDGKSLYRYDTESGHRSFVCEKNHMDFDEYVCAGEIIYSKKDSVIEVRDSVENEVLYSGAGEYAVGDKKLSAYRAGEEIKIMNGRNIKNSVNVSGENINGRRLSFTANGVPWLEDENGFYKVGADGDISDRIEFDGKRLFNDSRYLYAVGSPSENASLGVYRISLTSD